MIMLALFTDLDCGVAVNSSLQRYPIIGDQHHSSNIRTALEKESLLAHWSWCCLTNTWILWKTSFTWSVILLTELLLRHFIISVAAVLLLWSGQLTRNFNFTNGHWFPIAGIVYCLYCALCIPPGLVTPSLPIFRWPGDWGMMMSRGHELSGHEATSRVTICIRWHQGHY